MVTKTRLFYRVQKLESARQSICIKGKSSLYVKDIQKMNLYVSISQDSFNRYSLKIHQINAIGIMALMIKRIIDISEAAYVRFKTPTIWSLRNRARLLVKCL